MGNFSTYDFWVFTTSQETLIYGLLSFKDFPRKNFFYFLIIRVRSIKTHSDTPKVDANIINNPNDTNFEEIYLITAKN